MNEMPDLKCRASLKTNQDPNILKHYFLFTFSTTNKYLSLKQNTSHEPATSVGFLFVHNK